MGNAFRWVSLPVISLLAALASGPGPPPAGAAETPRYGGILNWYVYADPARLDIHSEGPLSVQQAVAGIYSGLLHYDPAEPSRIATDLAERYEVSADGKVYTFHLRKGVKWHDGKPFTAADVKASLDRVLRPDFLSPRCGSMLKPIVERVEVVDDFTVRVHQKFANAVFIPGVASAWCVIAAKHILERDGDLTGVKSQIGTGPFKFKRYERDSVIEWEKNRDYYDPKLPYLDGVKQFIIKARAAQLAAAKGRKIHLWDTWPPMTRTQAEEVKKSRGDEIEIYKDTLNTVASTFLNTRRPPFDNPEMRWAVHLAIDRQEVIEKVWEGAGTPCAILDPKVHGEFALALDEVNKLPGCRQPKDQDIAEAKRLVAKHHPNGVDIEVVVRSVGDYVERAQLVLNHLRRVGIRGTLKSMESAAGFAAYGRGEFVLIPTQDTAMVLNDPSDPITLHFTTQAGRNYGRHSDPKIDELAERGNRELDPAKRKRIYHDLQRHLLTTPHASPVTGWLDGWFFIDKKLRGYKPALTVYDNNTFRNVWLAP
jgi:peptide/nickel transport system substrate-binding protein